MYIRTITRLIPIVNSFKSIKHVTSQSIQLRIGPSLNTVCNNINIKLKSTNSKPHQEIKHVYYGVLTPQIKAVKIFSLTSSIVGIIAQPFLYKELVTTGNIPVIIAAYSFIGFFTFVTPILLHLVTKKYVTHLSYNEEKGTYTALTVNFFCVTKKTEFTPEDVIVPDVPGMFTTVMAKGKALFLDPRLFDQPEYYAKLMGYDKPMDFKLYESPPNENKKS